MKQKLVNPLTELDQKYLELGVCPNVKLGYAFCHDCELIYKIQLTCNKKNCVVCQKKRAYKLFNKYKKCVENWKELQKNKNLKIQFLTITNKNVLNIDRDYIDNRDRCLKLFLRGLQRANKKTGKKALCVDYGFINKECNFHKIGDPRYKRVEGGFMQQVGTYDESNAGYHYHYHILFIGERIELQNKNDSKFVNLQQRWKDLTKDSHIVNLRKVNFNDGEHSLRYMLKYVTKTQETSEEMLYFNEITKKKRFFQTFGKAYKKNADDLKIPFLCSNCGGNLSVAVICEQTEQGETTRKYRTFPDYVPEQFCQYKEGEMDYKKIKKYIEIETIKTKTPTGREKIEYKYTVNSSSRSFDKIKTLVKSRK